MLYVHCIDQKTKCQLTVSGFPILKVHYVYGHVSLLKDLSERKLVAFPDSAMLVAKFSNLRVSHLHKVQRCFRCKYLNLAHTRLYLLSFLFRRSFHALLLSLVNTRKIQAEYVVFVSRRLFLERRRTM